MKDKKIQILKRITVQDSEGFSSATWEPIHDGLLWAYFRQLSGHEIYAAMSVQATEEVLFVINWRNDISTAHVVQYNGRLYDITRVDTFERYKENLTLYCRLHG